MKIDLTKFQGYHSIQEAKEMVKEIEKTIKDVENKLISARGVCIGDVFANGKHLRCEVVDIYEQKSLVTGEVVDYICIARAVDGSFSTNTFDVPFSTVLRNKI